MKVVIATAVYYPMINGVAVFSRNLAAGLARRGVKVVVLCPSQTGKSHTKKIDGVEVHYLKSLSARVYPDQIHKIPDRRKIAGIRMPRVFYKHSFKVSVFPQREVKKILDKFRPDVVHIQVSDLIGLSTVSYARRHNIPVVMTAHNQPEVFTEPLRVPAVMKTPVEAIFNAYLVSRQSRSDFVTMPTMKAIQNLLANRKKDIGVPIAAVSNGVDLAHFRPGKVTAAFKKKYNLSLTAQTLLSLGRLDPEKNVGTVIDAFIKAREDLPDAQLVIVGDGVDRPQLEKKVSGRSDVHFLGRVTPPELYKIYQLGDVFVTASEIETQGIVLIEAAATGMPLIAVDRGAVGEVCQDGKNGCLCAPGDTDGIAAAMVKILSNDKLRDRYSEASLKIASEHDLERTLDQFMNIYHKVTEEKDDEVNEVHDII